MDNELLVQKWTAYLEKREEEDKNDLIEHYYDQLKPIATKAVRVISKHNHLFDIDDFMSFGAKALIQSVERYDPSKGTKFETYMWVRCYGAMLDGVRKESKMRRQGMLLHKAKAKSLEILHYKLERAPTEEELLKEIKKHIDFKLDFRPYPIFTSYYNDYQSGDEFLESHNDQLAYINDPTIDTEVSDTWNYLLKHCKNLLSDIEFLVVYYRYYKDMLMREIAVELQVSESNCSYHLQRAMKKLKRAASLGIIDIQFEEKI